MPLEPTETNNINSQNEYILQVSWLLTVHLRKYTTTAILNII